MLMTHSKHSTTLVQVIKHVSEISSPCMAGLQARFGSDKDFEKM